MQASEAFGQKRRLVYGSANWTSSKPELISVRRIAPIPGSEIMDTWESFFSQKSRRRSRHLLREAAIKCGILFVLFGSVATAVYLSVAGLPR